MEHGMRIALLGMERDACTTDGHADAHRGSLSAAAPCCLPPLCACCRVASARALLRQWQQRNGRTVSTPLPPSVAPCAAAAPRQPVQQFLGTPGAVKARIAARRARGEARRARVGTRDRRRGGIVSMRIAMVTAIRGEWGFGRGADSRSDSCGGTMRHGLALQVRHN
jgi:hypothetical protein